jgi:hypothetical protein
MSLHDLPTSVWEILLDKLNARHQARLVATGDPRVKRSIAQTWRTVNLLSMDDDLDQEYECLTHSELVMETLVKQARVLIIDAGNFSDLLNVSLPLLVSLNMQMCDNSLNAFAINMKASNIVAGYDEPTLDFAMVAPNLRSLTFEFGPADFRIVLPLTLESLEFSTDRRGVISRIDNFAQLGSLTRLDIDSGNLCDDIAWPASLTQLTINVTETDLAHVNRLPSTLRCLRVLNITSTRLSTGQFDYLLLLSELVIGDWNGFHGSCRLTSVPPSLTSLKIGNFDVDENGHLLDALSRLSPTLTSLSVDSISSIPDDAGLMKRHLDLLFPRMGLAELDHLTSSLTVNRMRTAQEDSLLHCLLEELPKRGLEGVHCAKKLHLLSVLSVAKDGEFLDSTLGQLVPMCASSGQRQLLKDAVTAYWLTSGTSIVKNLKSAENRIIASIIDGDFTLEIEADECSFLTPEITDKVSCLILIGAFTCENVSLLFSRVFSRVSRIVVNSRGRGGVGNTLVVARALCEKYANFPHLDSVSLEIPESSAERTKVVTRQYMANVRFYPVGRKGEFRFGVRPLRIQHR